MNETTYDCPTCRRRRLFEQPECVDGHGDACPEWLCTACGTALFADLAPWLDVDVRTVTYRVA